MNEVLEEWSSEEEESFLGAECVLDQDVYVGFSTKTPRPFFMHQRQGSVKGASTLSRRPTHPR